MTKEGWYARDLDKKRGRGKTVLAVKERSANNDNFTYPPSARLSGTLSLPLSGLQSTFPYLHACSALHLSTSGCIPITSNAFSIMADNSPVVQSTSPGHEVTRDDRSIPSATKRRKKDETERRRVSRACDRCKRYCLHWCYSLVLCSRLI